jgi:hypothetical protein
VAREEGNLLDQKALIRQVATYLKSVDPEHCRAVTDDHAAGPGPG